MTMIKEAMPADQAVAGRAAGTQALLRGLSVIDAVARGSATLAAIGNAIGCTRSTTQRLVSALVRSGHLRQVMPHGYRLGPRLIELGYNARGQMPLAALARPVIEALAAETQDTVHLGIAEGLDVLYLDKIPGRRGLEMRSRVGTRMPQALTGIGKALLLDADEAGWHRCHAAAGAPAHGDKLDWPAFRNGMQAAAARGFTVDLEENELGVRCVASPVRDAAGQIVAAISVASAAPYMPEDRMQALGATVCAAASRIGRELGWRAAS